MSLNDREPIRAADSPNAISQNREFKFANLPNKRVLLFITIWNDLSKTTALSELRLSICWVRKSDQRNLENLLWIWPYAGNLLLVGCPFFNFIQSFKSLEGYKPHSGFEIQGAFWGFEP